MSDFVPEARPVDRELEPDFDHATFPPAPVHFVPLMDKLDDPETRRKLLEMAQHVI